MNNLMKWSKIPLVLSCCDFIALGPVRRHVSRAHPQKVELLADDLRNIVVNANLKH